MSATTTTIERVTLADLERAGYLDGYRPGAPVSVRRVIEGESGEDIDRACCEHSTCEACGRVGLAYRPFHHVTRHSYVAYAVCPACGSAEEF